MGFDVLFFFGFVNLNIMRDFNFSYESLIEILVIVLLSIALLIVIATPVFLAYCWANYSFEYVREYRSRFSLKKWFSNRSDFELADVSDLVWMKYRTTYSRMVGFGFSIIAYAVASISYMIQNFVRLEQAMVEYFSFPFDVMKNLGQVESTGEVITQMEGVWKEMLYIVVISIIFFFVGYIYGSFLVDYRLKKLKKQFKKEISASRFSSNE
jgi:hypothetical protein